MPHADVAFEESLAKYLMLAIFTLMSAVLVATFISLPEDYMFTGYSKAPDTHVVMDPVVIVSDQCVEAE